MNTGMHYFMVLAETGSISAAAQRLFVSQQAFSEQMKRLEASFGTVLFIRKPRFSLTPSGEALLETLREIHILEQNLEVQLREIREQGIGRIHMGIHSTRARALLPQVIEAFRTHYPQVSLHISHGDTRELCERLLRGELDLLFGVDAPDSPKFDTISLAEEPIRLIASKKILQAYIPHMKAARSGSLSAAALRQLPLILSPAQSNFQVKINAFMEAHHIEPKSAVIIPDFELQLQLAKNAVGACFCPQMLLPKELLQPCAPSEASLLCMPVEELTQTSHLSLVFHRHTYHSSYFDCLLGILETEFHRYYDCDYGTPVL